LVHRLAGLVDPSEMGARDRLVAERTRVAGFFAQCPISPIQGLVVSACDQMGYGYSVGESPAETIERIQPHGAFERQ